MLRKGELVADDLRGMDGDRPRIDRPRQWLAIPVDDVGAIGNQRGETFLAAGVITESGEIQDSATR